MEIFEGELIINMYLIGIFEFIMCINYEYVLIFGFGYIFERCIFGIESRFIRIKKLFNVKSSLL